MNCVKRLLPKHQFLPFGLLALFVCPSVLQAASVCQTGSLSSYIGLNTQGGCTIGDVTFFRFDAPAPTVTGGAGFAATSQILVTPINSAAGVGFAFSATQGATNLFSIPNPTQTESATYFINYSLDPAPIIIGADISLDPPFGDVTAAQGYCLFDVFADSCRLGIPLSQSVTVASPNSQLTFPIASSFVDVTTTIALRATPGNPAAFDSFTTIYNLSSLPGAVPEPRNLFLTAAGGLLLLGTTCLASWRRRQRASALSK